MHYIHFQFSIKKLTSPRHLYTNDILLYFIAYKEGERITVITKNPKKTLFVEFVNNVTSDICANKLLDKKAIKEAYFKRMGNIISTEQKRNCQAFSFGIAHIFSSFNKFYNNRLRDVNWVKYPVQIKKKALN